MIDRRVRYAVALLGALSGVCRGAQSVVLPVGFDTREGNHLDGMLLTQGDGRRQWILDGGQLAPLVRDGRWQVRELWLRRDCTVPRGVSGGAVDVELWASATGTSPEDVQPEFALNRGRDHRVRCAIRITLPDLQRGAPGPAPWDERSAQALRFVLDPPVAGTGHLCLELVTHTVADQPLPAWCPDAVLVPPPPTLRFFGSSCALGRLVPRASATEASLVPGGIGELRLADVPPDRAALCLLDFVEPAVRCGHEWAPLDPTGAQDCTPALAGAPAAAVLTTATLVGRGVGEAVRRLAIPNDGALLGGRLYSQWLVLVPGINAAGAVASHGVEAAIASALSGFAITTVAGADPTLSTGQVSRHLVTVLRLVR